MVSTKDLKIKEKFLKIKISNSSPYSNTPRDGKPWLDTAIPEQSQ